MEFLKIAKIISNIHSIQESLQKQKEKEERAKVDKYCVHCGAKFKSGISLFCLQCGAADPVQQKETVKSAKRIALKVLGYILIFVIKYKSSDLSNPKKFSITALSRQLPLRLML